MPDLGVNIVPRPFRGADPEVKRNMARSNCSDISSDSNRTDSSGEEDVLVSKQGDALWAPSTGANRRAEHNLIFRHAPETPLLFSMHSAR